jgi:phosphotransferase system  glucose/maltose/N-acetylglucosamine-specific IIC component
VSSVSAGGQSNKRVIALILGIAGVLFLILGVVYLAVPAHSLPGFIGYIKNGGSGKHNLRMAGSFVIAVVCFAAAWFVNRRSGKSPASSDAGTPVDAPSRS